VTAFHSRFTSLSVSRPSGERASPRHLRERNRTSTAPKLSKTLWSRPFIPDAHRHFEGTDRSFALYVALLGRHRARYLTARLPMPPVRPVRETFTSYGSRERGVYRKLPFRQLHGTFTVVSLRVRWVPLYHFPTLSLRAFAMCAVFPCSDYYAQFDCLQGLGDFGTGLPCLLPTLLAIPFRLSRVQNGGLKQDDVGGVLLAAPSALCGSPVPAQGTQVRLCLLPHGRRNFHVSDLTSQTRIGVQA